MRSSTDFWKRRISRRAAIPGRKRFGFLTPPIAAALLRRPTDRNIRDLSLAVAPAIRLMAWLLVRALHKDSSSFSKHQTLTHTYIRWKKMTCQLAIGNSIRIAIEIRSGSRSGIRSSSRSGSRAAGTGDGLIRIFHFFNLLISSSDMIYEVSFVIYF